MKYSYDTKNTCSTKIQFDLDGDVVRNIEFSGGCSANLTAISRLLDDSTVSDIEEKLSGIQCGRRKTSCADQLAGAVKQAYAKSKEQII